MYKTTLWTLWSYFPKPTRICIRNSLKKDENIKKIIIFGSSLKPTCHIDSDIDIYLELDKNKRVNFPFITKAYDYWNNFTVDANLRNEIKKTGVTIYER